jgi:hypothetical protein
MRTKAGLLWGRRPVLYAVVARMAFMTAVAFGVQISAEQLAVLMMFIEAVLGLVTNSYTETNTIQPIKRRG